MVSPRGNKDIYIYKEYGSARLSLYATSEYPKDHPLHSMVNKKVFGNMKDDCAGVPIAEFVSLRSKIYSIMR